MIPFHFTRTECFVPARVAYVPEPPPLSGRRAQAAANDQVILESARAVFTADPSAPIAAVAQHAGVGISALYRRYPSKEYLLRTLAADGLRRFIDETTVALADDRGAWPAFADFMRRAIDADTSSLTRALAGTFTPTPEMWADGQRANELLTEFFERTRRAGVLRPDLEVHDLSLLFEQLSAVRVRDAQRTRELRHRYLALLLDAMREPEADPLPGPAPTWGEINERWAAQ
jgi:AcrR family transcriptional regulator